MCRWAILSGKLDRGLFTIHTEVLNKGNGHHLQGYKAPNYDAFESANPEQRRLQTDVPFLFSLGWCLLWGSVYCNVFKDGASLRRLVWRLSEREMEREKDRAPESTKCQIVAEHMGQKLFTPCFVLSGGHSEANLHRKRRCAQTAAHSLQCPS